MSCPSPSFSKQRLIIFGLLLLAILGGVAFTWKAFHVSPALEAIESAGAKNESPAPVPIAPPELQPLPPATNVSSQFSPDGSKVAHITSAGDLVVEDLNGECLVRISRACDPIWSEDGEKIIFSAMPSPDYPDLAQTMVCDLKSGDISQRVPPKGDSKPIAE